VKTWFAVEVVGDLVAHEAIEYGLMEAGSLGTETTDDAESTRVTGYFEGPQNTTDIERSLSEALRIYDLPRASFHSVSVGEVENRDWLAEWKKSWQPVHTGRFIIAPPWVSEPPAVAGGPIEDRIVIRINPLAFHRHETPPLFEAIETL
jgi:ribosomal protein L11 methylase PrmA